MDVNNGDYTRTLTWDFDDPADYNLTSTEVSGDRASLAFLDESAVEDSADDYASGVGSNIDTSTDPGAMILDETATFTTTVTIQPDAAAGVDTYLSEDKDGDNYGLDRDLRLDSETGKRFHMLLRFDLAGIPTDAIINDASLWLYEMPGGKDDLFSYDILALEQAFDEEEATWLRASSSTLWTTPGGDFLPEAYFTDEMNDTVGWREMNLRKLVERWVTSDLENHGLAVVPEQIGGDALKIFTSSDETTAVQNRPKLVVDYTIEGNEGAYESAALGPGTNATFTTASWSDDALSLITDEFSGATLSSMWTWMNDPALEGGSYNVGVSTPGWLRVTGSTNTANVDSSLGSNFLYQDVTGDFVAQTHLRELFTINSMDAGVLLVESNNSWMSISKSDISTSGKIRVEICEDGTSYTAVNHPWVAKTEAHLQVVRNDTGVWFLASDDGTVWEEIYHHVPTTYLMTKLRVGLFLQSGSSTQPVAEFDHLRVDPTVYEPVFRYFISTGDSSSLSDPSWSDWTELAGAGGADIDTVSKYVRYRVYLSTDREWLTPEFHGTEIAWQRYAESGIVETLDLSPVDFSVWLTMSTVHDDLGGMFAFYYSTDEGASWDPLGSTGMANIYSHEPTIRLRAVLSTYDTLATPSIDRLSVVYGTALSDFYVETPSEVVAGTPFAVEIWAKNSENITMNYWVGLVALRALDASTLMNASAELGITSWLISNEGHTTITGETYTAAETILLEVLCADGAGYSRPVEVVPGPVASVAILPEDLGALPEDTYEEFQAVAYDAYGNEVPDCEYSWTVSGGIGLLDGNDSSAVVLTAGEPLSEGYLNVTVSGVTTSRYITITSVGHPPVFTSQVPLQTAEEDGPSWSFDLSPYVVDSEDGDDQLRWYVTGEDLVSASGENKSGSLEMTLTPRPDMWGNDTLTVHVVDPEGTAGEAEVHVDISPVNDAPVISPIHPLVVRYDLPYIYSVRYYITDVDDDHDDLVLSVDETSAVYVDVNNDIHSLVFDYPESMLGTTTSVVLTVSDGDLSSSTIVQVTVSDDYVPILVENLPDVFMFQGEVMQGAFDLDEFFMDPDEDMLYYTSRTSIVHIDIDEENEVTIYAPLAGEEYVTFSAVDPDGARMEDTILVTVVAVNQPPTIADVPDLSVRYDWTYEFDLAMYVSDEDDEVDALLISTDDPYIAVVGTTLAIHYPLTFLGDTRTVNLTVSDGALFDWWLVNITVTDNTPPESTGPPDHSFTEDWPIQYPPSGGLEAWFSDEEDGDDLEFEAFSWTDEVTATATTDLLDRWYVYFWTEKDYYGESMVSIRAVDSEGAFVEETVKLTVVPAPDAPVFAIARTFNATVGVEATVDLSCCVQDPDSEPWQMTLSVPQEYAPYISTASTLVRMHFPESFLEPGEDSRTVDIVVRMTDQDGLWDTSMMTITVSRISATETMDWMNFALFLVVVGTGAGMFGFVTTMRRKPFVIQDMMIVHEDGFLISRHEENRDEEMDEDVFTGMMTAVLNFVEDSMSQSNEHLKTFGFEHYKVLVQRGKKIYAAVIFEGDRPGDIEENLGGFLSKIEKIYRKSLLNWTGDIEVDFAGMELLIKGFVAEHSKKRAKNGCGFLRNGNGQLKATRSGPDGGEGATSPVDAGAEVASEPAESASSLDGARR